ncbi:MAG: DUF3987 domain-containing protein, partial [Deltaproteobacteria bacterium]|nr:DUF3987 domain-containing protein [Deltaproteobacteria bacterium]
MPRTIEPRQEAIDALYARVFGEPKTEHSNSNRQNGHHLSLEDDVLLRKAFGAKNGHKIKALYEGDISAYPSHSEADLALCSFLVFYTQEEAQLDRLCRASKLYRDKWDKKHYGDGRTYGQVIIEKALAGNGQHYGKSNGEGRKSSNSSRSSNPPELLRRVLPPSEPYPVDALGDILAPAAQEMHEIIQSPKAICAQSLLAGASLAVQAHANINIDGRNIPLSEYFLSVAESGERKTATDNAALAPHEKRQRDLRAEYEGSIQEYEADHAAWKKSHDEILSSKDHNTRQEKTKALLELGPEPQAPMNGTLVTKEPTYEGLVKALAEGFPS